MHAAYLQRTISELNSVANGLGSKQRAGAFVEVAKTMAIAARRGLSAVEVLGRSTNVDVRNMIERATPTSVLGDFSGIDGASIQAAFEASLAPASILDAVLRYAKILPPHLGRVLVASGATGEATGEGLIRVVKDAGFSVSDCTEHQVSTVLVFTEEALTKGGAVMASLFETELRSAIARALNAELLTELDSSAAATVATTGDAVKDLRAALAKADPSSGYVYAAPGNTIAAMVTDPANQGADVRGGEFVPGIWLVADDALSEPVLIPAGRLVLQDSGLRLRPPATDASVNLAETPTSPSQVVSLWQTGSVGLIAQREWRMNTNNVTIVKVSA